MSQLVITALMIFMWIQGFISGYIIWGKDSAFKRGLVDGITLKFIWGRWVKR